MPSAFDTAHASDEVISHLVRAVVDTPATAEDYQKLAEIVQDAQKQNLEPDQIEAKIRENTPFTNLSQLLRQHRVEIVLALLQILVSIVIPVWISQQPTKVEIVKPDINEILKELEKHIDENRPVPPAPTDTAHHHEPPGTSCS